ncbi:unnamed protein product, partial [Amoebophrya sp. A120]|eukprot:GSA120T00026138001.1
MTKQKALLHPGAAATAGGGAGRLGSLAAAYGQKKEDHSCGAAGCGECCPSVPAPPPQPRPTSRTSEVVAPQRAAAAALQISRRNRIKQQICMARDVKYWISPQTLTLETAVPAWFESSSATEKDHPLMSKTTGRIVIDLQTDGAGGPEDSLLRRANPTTSTRLQEERRKALEKLKAQATGEVRQVKREQHAGFSVMQRSPSQEAAERLSRLRPGAVEPAAAPDRARSHSGDAPRTRRSRATSSPRVDEGRGGAPRRSRTTSRGGQGHAKRRGRSTSRPANKRRSLSL